MRVGPATLSYLKRLGDAEAELMLKAGAMIFTQAQANGLTPGFFFIEGKFRLVPVPSYLASFNSHL
jgi:hypothetical protein